MIYKVDRIMRDVRIAIDENMTSRQLVGDDDIDTLSLDDIIQSKIEDGVRRAESRAPTHFLEEGHSFGKSIYWAERESGWTLLPDDFMRLISFRMSDWERTCHSAISAEDPRYGLQSSRYKGIRGNPQKPVCAIVNRPEGKVLEFYSCKNEEARVIRATYLPYPYIDEYGGIDISERCYTAAVYTIASLVSTAYGASEKSAALEALAQSIFE